MQANRKKQVAVIVIVIMLAILLLELFRDANGLKTRSAMISQQSQTKVNPAQPLPAHGVSSGVSNPAEVQSQRFTAAFLTPISFYGKVVDQYGLPVSEANVKLSSNDKPLGGNPSEYSRNTDANGLFSISGIVGLTLAVEVSKPGYRVMPPVDNKTASSGIFEYGLSSAKGPYQANRNAPTIFTLHKYGQLVALKKVGEKNFKVARDGTPLSIFLDNNHQIVIRCINTELNRPAGQREYDWRLEINVLNGGLIIRKDSFVFEAPESGYQSGEIINMPTSLPIGQWRDSVQRSYFIQFNDNTFARVNLDMQAGGDHFVVWESFLNPTPGSRNLEFDPAKVLKSP